jgi:PAS domain S-box-containing protein
MKKIGLNKEKKMGDQFDVSFRVLAEMIPAGIYLTDSSGHCLYVNPAWCRMAGLTNEESIGNGWINAIHKEDRTKITSEWDSFVRGEIPWESEYRFVDSSGKITWVHGTATLIRGSNGSVEGIIGININITDRKIYEIELKESEERLRLASEATGFGTFSYEFETGSAFYSVELLDLYGLSAGDTLELDQGLVVKAIHPDDRQRFLTAMHKANDPCGSGILDIEFRIIRKDGNERWLKTRGLTKFTGNKTSDRPLSAAGIVQDITDRKITDEKLYESEKKYRNLVELSPNGIAVYQNGLFVYVNAVGLKMMGCKDQEALIGKPVLSIVHPDSRREVIKRMKLVANGITVSSFEEKLLRIDGSIYEAEVISIPVTYNDEPAAQVIVKDITERKKAEKELKEKEANLRSLIENSDWSIWSINRNFDLIYANTAFIEYFRIETGRSLNIGDNVTDGMPVSIKDDWIQYYKRCLDGEHFNIQTNTLPPLALKYMRYNFNPIRTKDGEVIGLTIIGQNVSDLKKTEEKLKKSAYELRELSRHVEDRMEIEKNTIAHDLHDDLGQKLTALNMDISWLKTRIGVQSRTVENKMRGMSQLLNDSFESLRKISYGLRPSILDNLGLHPAIEWQLSEFKKSTGINYSLSFVPKEKVIDNKLSLVVFRIIQESLTNISRHSQATKVTVKIKLDNEKLKLLVIDNGNGFNIEILKNHQSFGLFGMKERARSYGGEVTVRGKEGKGTVVTLDIPIKPIK